MLKGGKGLLTGEESVGVRLQRLELVGVVVSLLGGDQPDVLAALRGGATAPAAGAATSLLRELGPGCVQRVVEGVVQRLGPLRLRLGLGLGLGLRLRLW